MKAIPKGCTAVMSRRIEPPDSLDYFPTPPWATRALCEHLNIWGDVSGETCEEPACGDGHMVRPLREFFRTVFASDVYDYGGEQQRVSDFLLHWDRAPHLEKTPPDWIITNPPFRLAEQFALRALEYAHVGVALLVRTAFLESTGRWQRLFNPRPPEWILQFTERVPMVKGRCDPEASSATAYCWIIWLQPATPKRNHFPAFVWISPCRKRLERPEDYR